MLGEHRQHQRIVPVASPGEERPCLAQALLHVEGERLDALVSPAVVQRSCLRCGPPGPVLPIVGLALLRVVRNSYARRGECRWLHGVAMTDRVRWLLQYR